MIADLEDTSVKLNQEQDNLLDESETLQEEVRNLKKENQMKKTKNAKLEAQVSV